MGRRVRVTMAGGSSEAGTAVIDERFDAATLHLLRARVTACAAAAGMPADLVPEVTLAVHELAANAVRHGAGEGRLLLYAAPGSLRCLVSDAGRDAGPWPVRQGHGLWIVREVADQVTVSSGPQGSRIVAVFSWRGAANREGRGSEAT